ncbi:MAG: hypothetical protein WBP93_12285, partial [Pyrinomonadaceae bacterium]
MIVNNDGLVSVVNNHGPDGWMETRPATEHFGHSRLTLPLTINVNQEKKSFSFASLCTVSLCA